MPIAANAQSCTTAVCNAAISHCGTRSKISAIDEGSAEANACLTHLALVRDATLRAFDWNFARITAQLAELTSPPARWRHKYALPTDCLRLRRLNDVPLLALPETFCEVAADRDSTGAFVTVLLTQAAPVAAIYTAQVADPLRWDAGTPPLFDTLLLPGSAASQMIDVAQEAAWQRILARYTRMLDESEQADRVDVQPSEQPARQT